MSLPRYSEYKDSGVAWLGEVPGHWQLTKIKHVIQFQTGWTPPTGNAASYEGDNLWANISDLGEKWITDTSKCISDEAVSKAQISISPKGSLMFSFKLSIGQVSFAGQDMYTNEAIATFLPSSAIFLGYAYYAFPLFLVQNASENIYGAKLLNQELIRAASLVLPNETEQQTIAAFLDRETGKIDALIAEQQRLVELLAEKRQAVISHAVTKGLNPNTKMKDSGIEWLGEVPEHWSVVPLGHLATQIQTGPFGSQLHSEDYVEGETPVINPSNIQDGKLVADWSCTVTQEIVERLSQHKLMYGDIVFGRRGEMGRCALVTANEVNWLCGTGSLNVRLSDRSNPEFVSVYLRTAYVRELLKLESVGSTMDNLNTQILSCVPVPLPPCAEQQAITTFLDTQTAKFDALTEEANRAIALLQERRAALISAAVTGKIDVRHHAIEAFRGQGQGGATAQLLADRNADTAREG